MVEKASDVMLDIVELPDNDKVSHIVEGKNLETPIVASIQTLKGNSKKCGKEEVFRLVQEYVESEVTKEIFKKLLDALVECHSVKIKLVVTRTFLSLPTLGQYSNSNENSTETLTINANEELIKCKNSITEKFDALKSSFFLK